jgi:hypothetical protein
MLLEYYGKSFLHRPACQDPAYCGRKPNRIHQGVLGDHHELEATFLRLAYLVLQLGIEGAPLAVNVNSQVEEHRDLMLSGLILLRLRPPCRNST